MSQLMPSNPNFRAPETYTITVSDVDGYDFDYFTYNGMTLGRPATIQLTEDGVFTAHYSP
ncbi:MAG: hypothetical protein IAX21_07425 [Candidatus Bathyarchaeota archaeon]|nr:MAG: hypothetical protein IAX21_07425 [Candidatus Bathyarchaeota archaeon]